MTLAEIRKATEKKELLPAIMFLCDNMDDMTFGEFMAYKRTLESKAQDLNISVVQLNNAAEQYQVFGYDVEKSI